MGKNSGSSQINNASNWYNQEAQNANTLTQQFNANDLPQLQNLFSLYHAILNGQPNAMTTAAQAPVNANTAHALNTMQSNEGGVTNPDALYSDMALSGNQNAALAGDNLMGTASSGLQSLLGMGYGSLNTAQSSLNNAAGGSGNLGLNMNQQSNAAINSLLGGLGSAAGMWATGGASGLGGAAAAGGGSVPFGGWAGFNPSAGPISSGG